MDSCIPKEEEMLVSIMFFVLIIFGIHFKTVQSVMHLNAEKNNRPILGLINEVTFSTHPSFSFSRPLDIRLQKNAHIVQF
jgi:hypothetical protein